jgi:hypothetical protein
MSQFTLTLNVFSDNDDKIVFDFIQDLQKKQILDVAPIRKSIAIPGSPISSQELTEQIELARKSTKKYTEKEAKRVLQL